MDDEGSEGDLVWVEDVVGDDDCEGFDCYEFDDEWYIE